MSKPALTCREAVEFIADYLAGELAPEVRVRFEEHLAECPECLGYLGRYTETIRLAKSACATEEGLPPEMPEELVQAIVAARRDVRRPRGRRRS